MIPSYARCIRDGVMNYETPVRNLVRGDIVRVLTGDIVPADIRIIESKGFKVCAYTCLLLVSLDRSNVQCMKF